MSLAAPLIQWEFEYDAWQLFACLTDWLIKTAQQGSVAGNMQYSLFHCFTQILTRRAALLHSLYKSTAHVGQVSSFSINSLGASVGSFELQLTL